MPRDIRLLSSDPHREMVQRAEALKAEACTVRKLSKQQLSKLEEKFASEVKEQTKGKGKFAKMQAKEEFAQKLEEGDLTDQIDAYLCYSAENKRFFDVKF